MIRVMTTVVLIHGGLHEDMDADRFWIRPGIVAGLRDRGLAVLAPDRLRHAPSWAAEVDHLLPTLPSGPIVLIGGSNGCSVAVRLVLALAHRVHGLALCWPATAGDSTMDEALARRLGGDALLVGDTLRGVSDTELADLNVPVAVVPSDPPNRVHQRRTVDALLRLLPSVRELAGCPEPPHPSFEPDGFVRDVAAFVAHRP
jgi:pimeloyl-ACP methyl ester carboxylesterase